MGLTLVARDFDMLEEILIRVHAEGWRILEIPFHYMSRGSGRSHVRLFKFGWAFAKTLVRMWRLRNSVAAADYDDRAFDSPIWLRSEEHTSELQSQSNLVCRLLLEKKNR